MQGAPCIPDSHPHRVTNTKCRIDTVISPDDGRMVTRNMQRKEINILRKTVHQVRFIYKFMVDPWETGSYNGLWVELIQIHVHWWTLILGCWTFHFPIPGDSLKLSSARTVLLGVQVTCSLMVSSTEKPEVQTGRHARWWMSHREMTLVAWTVLFVLCDITVPPHTPLQLLVYTPVKGILIGHYFEWIHYASYLYQA